MMSAGWQSRHKSVTNPARSTLKFILEKMSIHEGVVVLQAIFAFWFAIQTVLIFDNRTIYAHPLVLAISGFIMCLLSTLTILSLLC